MKFRTKGNTIPKGKQYIFVHAAPEDEKLRNDVILKLLSFEQGQRYCLWYEDEPDTVFTEEGQEKLREMAVFIPLITDNYFRLLRVNTAGWSITGFIESIQLHGTAVLPLLESTKLLPRFNKLFGEIHGVALSLPDADRMAEEQLGRFLSDHELEERITKEAFTGKLFLSYRKKDIKEAREIMKAIHDTDAAGTAAIWFDEFLVAGRDFNNDIMDNLAACDAMALAVTPNILEEGNYVRETEYNAARDRGKDVLPVEAVHADDEEVESAFPGITPRVNMYNRPALEELLKKAGFNGPGSRSALAEYLLGMAFFIPVNVEKDVERAVRLFETSAGHDCVEACEQLGRLYLKGIGVKRDYKEAIRYKKKAFDLLMKKEISEENIRHINKLFYEYDGLPLLLKDDGRVTEANQIQQAFLNRIESSPYRNDNEFILYQVNALTDLANLFYEYDLDTGNQKNTGDPAAPSPTIADILGGGAAGPDESRLKKAEQFADQALRLLDSYSGDDEDMAAFLRVVTFDQYADLCKYRNDLEGAVSYKEKSREIIEPLAERTGNLEYMDRSFQVSNNLGLFYREAGKQNYAVYHIDMAVKKAKQLEKISPEFRGRLVHALSNKALVTNDRNLRMSYAVDCYEALLKLLKDMDINAAEAWSLNNIGGEFSSAVHNIKLFSGRSDRKPVYERIYGSSDVGISDVYDSIFDQLDSSKLRSGCLQWLIVLAVVICFILQKIGVVDITGFLRAKLGPHGIWYAVGAVVFLYLLTCIPRGDD